VRVLRALRSSAVWPELVEEWREIEKPAINTLAADLIYTRVVGLRTRGSHPVADAASAPILSVPVDAIHG
jgi:hypothetical protein